MTTFKQVPLTCGGHTRPVVHLDFSDVTNDGYYLISACKGEFTISLFGGGLQPSESCIRCWYYFFVGARYETDVVGPSLKLACCTPVTFSFRRCRKHLDWTRVFPVRLDVARCPYSRHTLPLCPFRPEVKGNHCFFPVL